VVNRLSRCVEGARLEFHRLPQVVQKKNQIVPTWIKVEFVLDLFRNKLLVQRAGAPVKAILVFTPAIKIDF